MLGGSRLPEQFFRRGAVGRCALDVRLDPRDLGLEGFDARPQLLDRDGVEILLCKLGQRVAGFAREKLVQSIN